MLAHQSACSLCTLCEVHTGYKGAVKVTQGASDRFPTPGGFRKKANAADLQEGVLRGVRRVTASEESAERRASATEHFNVRLYKETWQDLGAFWCEYGNRAER